MAVPTGTASLLDIQNEFGGAAPISLSEYYGAASGVPTSGAISINDFRGASAAIVYEVFGTIQQDPFKADQAVLKVSNNQVLSNVFSGPANRAFITDGYLSSYSVWFSTESGGDYTLANKGNVTFPNGLPTQMTISVGGVTIASSSELANINGIYYFNIPDISYILQPYVGQTPSIKISMPT